MAQGGWVGCTLRDLVAERTWQRWEEAQPLEGWEAEEEELFRVGDISFFGWSALGGEGFVKTYLGLGYTEAQPNICKENSLILKFESEA